MFETMNPITTASIFASIIDPPDCFADFVDQEQLKESAPTEEDNKHREGKDQRRQDPDAQDLKEPCP